MDFSNIDHKRLLNVCLVFQGMFGFAFAISAFVVAGTANQGFNVVLTALVYIAYVIAALQVINKRQTPLSVGTIIGVSFVLIFISLMTSVFWGQLAGCEEIDGNVEGYTCENKPAMRAVCAFAIFMLLSTLAFTVMLVMWRDDILQESSTYDEVHERKSSTSASAQPYTGGYDPVPNNNAYNKGASADL